MQKLNQGESLDPPQLADEFGVNLRTNAVLMAVSSGRVSEVLNRKRRLSLQMVKKLHVGLHIPYESLLASV
ncbi:hypothetical protein [Rhodoferax sp.]|uniref:hypothetical protein n=1 Tax=Rhodoferax sp. TaxID=50421 RepID=UPI002734C30B|nr:hypothetical protein [Rhodoferax sp.]